MRHDGRIVAHIVFFPTPGVHLLDLAGPAQVLTTARGLPVAGLEWPRIGPGDLIVVPGRAAGPHGSPGVAGAVLDVLRAHQARGGTVAGVGTGTEVLGRAGPPDGRTCTTRHDLRDEPARRHPKAVVVRDVLFTADDRVLASAGSAGGIDLALHLVATRHGPAVAARMARQLAVHPCADGNRRRRARCSGTARTSTTCRTAPRTSSTPASACGCRSSPPRSASVSAPCPGTSPGPPASPRSATSRHCGWSTPST